jgi:putative zinc finger/helix-turn-helix YgiT family protein
MKTKTHECTICGQPAKLSRANYRYTESGLSNVILQGIEIAECPHCANQDVLIPHIEKIHRAIAQAITNSPGRIDGDQLRFLRTHLGLTGEKLGTYLHTDKTKNSKWERGEHTIGPTTDHLLRLLVIALDSDLRPAMSAVAEHLPLISNGSNKDWELHLDVNTLQCSFLAVSRAA